MSFKTILAIVVFVLAAGMVITLLVFWNVYIISDYHTIRELYISTHGNPNVPATGRWTVLSLGITFFSIVLVVLTAFFIVYLRGSRFKQQQKDFVNMMTHELKLPMSSIQMFAQTMVQREATPEDRHRFLELILNDCARMNQLLDHLLKAQQIEQGRMPIERQRLLLRPFLETFVERWPRPLQLRWDEGSDAQVLADPVLLELALVNLVNNAEKYGKGSVPELSLAGDSRRARISVHDAGTPIPKRFTKKIFKRFFRMPTRETRRQNGVGLGLYIVKSIVRMHKGSVELTTGSQETDGWKGNCFTLNLPRAA